MISSPPGTTKGNDERSDAQAVELQGMIEAGAIDGRGPAVVLGGAEDTDGVGRRGLILIRRSSRSGA